MSALEDGDQQPERDTALFHPLSQETTYHACSQSLQTSGLLRLSAELRNAIYELLEIEYDDAFWITADRHSEIEDIGPAASPPPIAQVCRSLREETLPIFYGANVFSLCLMRECNVDRTLDWITAVGDVGVSHIRHLRLRGSARDDMNCYQVHNITTLIQRTSDEPQLGINDESRPSQPRAYEVSSEAQDSNSIPVAPVTQQVVARLSDASSGILTVACLQRMVELFAGFCTFRNERAPEAPTEILTELDGFT